ncbi:succinate--hydroxymethylglutarate CoA-transferase [Coccinella septempunctata]|uniref:succinate--hydroxymethylglutarate CoA-transferase n=1 Tax=Coccinella septempunctata TaxID=41139 RepID=UPI001D06BFF1|nr:succinate--hydroxymethylglutarate CoA-transferase [Coccinella septempunctata]
MNFINKFTIKHLHILHNSKIAMMKGHSFYCNSAHNILGGVRIIDMTRIIAGPFCSMILGDLGAEVIKIEKPGSGDEARKWGPPFINNTTESCYFVAVNRNKKSVCVDLKSAEGKEIIYDLAKSADILVENYVPGTLDNLKLGYNDLKNIAPQLIYCSISGYGSKGPYMKRPGYDVIAQSVGGLLNITGPIDGEPVKVGVAVTDLATGLYAQGAILAALIHRTKTGKGQKIDCDLFSTQIASLINIGSNYLNGGKEAQRWGTAHESLVPYQMFKTLDGYLTIGAGSDLQFQNLCKKIGMNDLSSDPKYKTNVLRVKHRDELLEILEKVLCTKTNKEWMEIFAGSSFPCGPVNTLRDVFSDPHLKAIDLVQTLNHPKTGEIKVVGPPVKYSDGLNEVRSPPPLLGEHTEDVLKNCLNYDEEKIDYLKRKNVIQ